MGTWVIDALKDLVPSSTFYRNEAQASQAVAAFHPSPTTIRNLSNSPEEVGKVREIAEPPGA